MGEELLTVAQAAKAANVSYHELRTAMAGGRVKAAERCGRWKLFRRSQLPAIRKAVAECKENLH